MKNAEAEREKELKDAQKNWIVPKQRLMHLARK